MALGDLLDQLHHKPLNILMLSKENTRISNLFDIPHDDILSADEIGSILFNTFLLHYT